MRRNRKMPFKPIADKYDYPEKLSPRPKDPAWIAKHQEENMIRIIGQDMFDGLSTTEKEEVTIMKNKVTLDSEIKLLKRTVKALAKYNLSYRVGKTTMPEWVFDYLDAAKSKYGEDLTKII